MRKRLTIALGVAAACVMALVAAPSTATFPGQDGLISFARFVPKKDNFEIFTARPDGTDVQKLTSTPGRRISFLSDWSPDGERIAFESDRERAFQIYTMNADGSGLTQLTRGAGFHGSPGWSPDGDRLAITTAWGNYPAQQGIWIIPASDPDGVTRAEAERLTAIPKKGFEFDEEPQFSPDGSSVVFTRFKSFEKAESAIHRVSVDGTGLERLTPWDLNASDPDWSPDGQMITFDSGDVPVPRAKPPNIYVMGADGSGRTRLTDSPKIREGERFKFPQNPVWSPSGTKIMYTRFQGRRFDLERPFPGGPLVSINPDGSGEQVVVRGVQNKVDWGTHP